MPTASVLLAPPLPADRSWDLDRFEIAADLQTAGVGPVVVPPGTRVPDSTAEGAEGPEEAIRHWLAQTALHLRQSLMPQPTLLVLGGTATAQAPALGFAMQAARRAISGYVLIGGLPDAGTVEWPNAPVVLVSNDVDLQSKAQRRGYEILGGFAPQRVVEVAQRP